MGNTRAGGTAPRRPFIPATVPRHVITPEPICDFTLTLDQRRAFRMNAAAMKRYRRMLKAPEHRATPQARFTAMLLCLATEADPTTTPADIAPYITPGIAAEVREIFARLRISILAGKN